MAKVNILSLEIKSKKLIKEYNVSSFIVSNLSNTPANFLFNGVTRTLPPVDVDGLPVNPFMISDNGHFFDVELNFNENTNDIILDYTVLNQKIDC